MRALVTGGAGAIGAHVTKALVNRGDNVIVLDSLARGGAEALDGLDVELIRGTIAEAPVRELVGRCEAVFHLAGPRMSEIAETPRVGMEAMADTFNVIEACAEADVSLILSSSASLYEPTDRLPIPESHPPYGGNTLYGTAKVMAEGTCRAFTATHGLRHLALRYFMVYGPYMDDSRYPEVLTVWLRALDAGQPLRLEGEGRQMRDWIHMEDVARANLLALDAIEKDTHGFAVNVGTGRGTTLREVAAMLRGAYGFGDYPVDVVPPHEGDPLLRRRADTAKAKATLGFTAEVELEDGLDRLVNWWRASR